MKKLEGCLSCGSFLTFSCFFSVNYSMSKAVIEIYDALKIAGMPDDKVTAAKLLQIFGQENRFNRIEKEIIVEIKGDIKIVKWMLGIIIAGILFLILKTFFKQLLPY